MRFSLLALLSIAGVLWAHDPVSTHLTWSREISRILYKRCAGCHSPGGRAPMPLLTYADARPWAKAIKEEVLQRRMPPWGAVKGFGDFRDDPSLAQEEILRIADWVEGGAPEGDPINLRGLNVESSTALVPAGKRVRRVRGPVRLLAVRPLTTIPSAQVVATLPDGSKIPLLWLRDYKRSWNRFFVYRDPIMLPRGTVVTAFPQYPFEYVVKPVTLRVTRLR